MDNRVGVKMFTRDLIIWGCFFVLSGCVYDDEPMPEIVEDYTRSGKVIKPVIKRPTERRRDIYENIPADWFPARHLEDKNRWHGIIIHHSGSYYGSAAHEHKYHKSIGWDGLGYYFVINNGIFKNGYGRADGLVEVGYRWRGQQTGSHCRPSNDHSNYWNKHTIGICLIGNLSETRPTERQWRSLVKLVRFLQKRYNIPTSQIKGHRDIKPTDCPGKYFSFVELRRRLARY